MLPEQISSRVGIWSCYKYSKCLPSVSLVVISVTTKLKLGFDGENLIAGVSNNYELTARSQLTDCSFSGKN